MGRIFRTIFHEKENVQIISNRAQNYGTLHSANDFRYSNQEIETLKTRKISLRIVFLFALGISLVTLVSCFNILSQYQLSKFSTLNFETKPKFAKVSELDLKPALDSSTETNTTPNPEITTETNTTPNPEITTETNTTPEPEITTETNTTPNPEITTETNTTPNPEITTETNTTPNPEMTTETNTTPEPEITTETNTTPNPEITTETNTTPNPEITTETNSTPEPEITTEANSLTEPEFSTDLEFSSCFPTCQTKWCNIYSDILNATMNMSMDPCEDFFEYVCGNWNPSISSSNYLSIQIENAHDIVQYALEYRNATLQSKSKLIQYLTYLYQDCVDVPKRKQIDFAQLLRQLMGNTCQLSLFDKSKMSHSNTKNYRRAINSSSDYEEMLKLWNSTDVEQWMDCFVEASLNGVDTIFKNVRVSNKEIYFMYNDKPYEIKNQSLHTEFLKLKKKISSFFKINSFQWHSSLNYVLFEIIDFKSKLGNLYSKHKIDYNYNTPWPIMQFLKRDNNSANFNWTLLLGKFANKTGTTTQFMADASVKVITQVVSENFDLLTPIIELICSTPIRVLKNVMAIDYIDVLQSRNLIVDKHFSSAPSEADRLYLWKQFSYNDFKLFLPPYTRLFIDYVGRVRMRVARHQANDMLQNIKRTFAESLRQDYTWLDEQTRVKALEKMNAIQSMISHPDWIFNDTALDEKFGFDKVGQEFSVPHTKGNFVASYFNLLHIVQSENFRKLNKNDSKETERKFDFAFYEIGFNVLTSNYISITHALLLDPSFNVDYPIGLNYGNLGTTIGHEFVHGFDNNGIKFGKRGETVNWWTDAATQNYTNHFKCFVEQYNKAGGNGTLTLGENIADNGGLNLAYRLFEKHFSHSEKQCNLSSATLPHFLSQFSHEKLFFLAFGLEGCSHRNYASNWHPTDTHSADKYRVNIPLQNSDKFAQAFNCPVGSKMNPEKKCLLW